MTPSEFVARWRHVELTERAASQSHFIDVCKLVGHRMPVEADPKGEWFCFEKGVTKQRGGRGWADVWKRDCFGWEYKGKHKDLDAAYDQLLRYRENLENPPLLVVCDLDRIIIHTNFNRTAKKVHAIALDEIGEPKSLEILGWLFNDPDKLHPGRTSEAVTVDAARELALVAEKVRDRVSDSAKVARYLDRIVFCLFAESVDLLPGNIFRNIVEKSARDPARFARQVGQLFEAMAYGGDFGTDEIRHFNGSLFADGATIRLNNDEIARVASSSRLDWGSIDPSIFGTLFERGMDPAKRSQLGAHYTGLADIENLIDPVVMQPLRREWLEARQRVETSLAKAGALPHKETLDEARVGVREFLDRLQSVRVLDPACGSGNFLYVTLQKLKDLEKEVLVFADDHGIGGYQPAVGPWQLYGIEKSPYAFDLAQVTAWIGWLQWRRANGFRAVQEPILRTLDNFRCMDAVLDLSDPANPREPEWPEADFIVGNPPFLGGKKMRRELGDAYVDALFKLWGDRVRPEADLCVYWFEKARRQVETGRCGRAGLLATQAIRGGANRETLKRVKETGDIFFGISDRDWILDGATVHVSMVGFDRGQETSKVLDGRPVSNIHSDLTASVADVTTSRRLAENLNIAFMGDTKGGPFDIEESQALSFLRAPNPHGRPNSDVVVPWINGLDVTRRRRNAWIIDVGVGTELERATLYEAPFVYLQENVEAARGSSRSKIRSWWLHERPRVEMRRRIDPIERFICTANVSKFRLFVWMESPILPDHQLIAFARADDYFFGVLHSRAHEVWARSRGTQVRDRESGFRYTPTTCFETFPFPDPTEAQRAAIAKAARGLDDLRNGWLNPPEWTREDVLEFPGSVDGPWSNYVCNPDARGIGTVRYPKLMPKDSTVAKDLAKRTLTNLYNKPPAWLKLAHAKLDAAVLAAYGLAEGISDDDLLARLLALNLERDPVEGASVSEGDRSDDDSESLG